MTKKITDLDWSKFPSSMPLEGVVYPQGAEKEKLIARCKRALERHHMTNIEKILEVATYVFNDEQKAIDWIDHMSATLGDTPRNLAISDSGCDKVIAHLKGIDRHVQG